MSRAGTVGPKKQVARRSLLGALLGSSAGAAGGLGLVGGGTHALELLIARALGDTHKYRVAEHLRNVWKHGKKPALIGALGAGALGAGLGALRKEAVQVAHVDPPKIQTPKRALVPVTNAGPPKPPTVLSGLNKYEQGWNTRTKQGSISAQVFEAFMDQLEKRAHTLVPALRSLLEPHHKPATEEDGRKAAA